MVQEIQCPSCGTSLSYSYGVEDINCGNCGNIVTVDPYAHTHLPDYEQDILRVLRTGKYVDAVQMVRHRSGIGLNEAKQYVDRLAARNQIPVSTGSKKGMLLVVLLAVGIMVGVAFAVFALVGQ
ncbi:MAG: hypothetical protein GY771_06905 [bacterium]|nr:hypothetical protein [bacterium]